MYTVSCKATLHKTSRGNNRMNMGKVLLSEMSMLIKM